MKKEMFHWSQRTDILIFIFKRYQDEHVQTHSSHGREVGGTKKIV